MNQNQNPDSLSSLSRVEKHDFRVVKWLLLAGAVGLLIINLVLLRQICQDNWLTQILGYAKSCQSSVGNLPNANGEKQQLSISGTSLTLSGGGSVDLSFLTGAPGPAGADGLSGNTGGTGAKGATGSSGTADPCVASSTYFCQNGNSFGALATLGTTDAHDLVLETNGAEHWRVTQAGRLVATNANFDSFVGGSGNETTTGFWNTANGQQALQTNTVGTSNTANGLQALYTNDTGDENTANGFVSLAFNTSGNNNTANGTFSLYHNTIGSNNSGNGSGALFFNSDGSNNTAEGYSAGSHLTTGDNNLALGANTDFASNTGSNQLNIANNIFGTGLNGSVGAPAGQIGIGTAAPANLLSVAGNANTAGHSAFGSFTTSVNDGSLFWPGSSFDNVISQQETLTNPAVSFAEGVTNYVNLNPSAGFSLLNSRLGLNLSSPTYTGYAADNEIRTDPSNVEDFGKITGGYSSAAHYGSGNVDALPAIEGVAYNAGSGNVFGVYGLAVQYGNIGSGTVSNNVGAIIESGFNTGGGTLTNNYGLIVQDQSGVGSGDNYNIYSEGTGSTNYFAGKVGIGTSTPAHTLDVTNTGTDQTASFTGTTQTCIVDTSGAGGWNCTSDERLKTNIVDLTGSLDKLMQLQGVTYNFKANADGQAIAGFVAQDVQKILPDLVGQDKNGYLNLNKDGMIPYIVEAVKEQNGKLDDVNKQLAAQGITINSISDELKTITSRLDEHDKKFEDQQAQIDDLKAQLKQLKNSQTNSPTNIPSTPAP